MHISRGCICVHITHQLKFLYGHTAFNIRKKDRNEKSGRKRDVAIARWKNSILVGSTFVAFTAVDGKRKRKKRKAEMIET